MKYPALTDEQLVEKLCAVEDGMTEWEAKFVGSIGTRCLDEERPLTPAQRAKAEEILELVLAREEAE